MKRGRHEPDEEKDKQLIRSVLKDVFGFDKFQGRQEEAILAALAGRDSLVLMPTGGGKSLCYCMPAVAKKGLVVTISPLIALMENQVANLRSQGVACDFLSSTRSAEEKRSIYAGIRSSPPTLRLLFATPELVTTEGFLDVLRGLCTRGALSLVAVDEAHCISSWGQDFRPAYRKLSAVRRELPGVPLMALTATAAAKVQFDIVQQLHLRNPARLLTSFNRPNIHYSVVPLTNPSCSGANPADPDDENLSAPRPGTGSDGPAATAANPMPLVAALLREARGSAEKFPTAIVYTLKRETAAQVAFGLTKRGIPCEAYHAGLPAAERTRILAGWGTVTPVVAATVAFGMGIDRPDVRLVLHYNLPKSLEGFYQESGRAGRDGLPAKSVLLYTADDRSFMDFILTGANMKKKHKQRQSTEDSQGTELAAFAKVVKYATEPSCRRAAVLAHFGETLPPGGCGAGCDVCQDPAAVRAQLAALELEALERTKRQVAGGWRGGGGGMGSLRGASFGGYDAADSNSEEAIDSDSDGEGLPEEEREAAAVAARARKAGSSEEAVFDALAAAEARHAVGSPSPGKGSKAGSSLLRKLSSISAPSVRAAPAAPTAADAISGQARDSARARLRTALAGNAALGLEGGGLDRAAAALEQECFAGASSKTVYLSRVASAALQAKRAAAMAQLLAAEAALLKPSSDSSSKASGSPDSSSPPSAQQLFDEVSRHAAAAAASPEALAAAVAGLGRLAGAAVSRELLAVTGLGKRVAALKRHASPQIARSAGVVVDTWKAALSRED